MTKRKGILLASFLNSEDEEEINHEVQFIAENINLTNPYIFLLQNVNDPEKKIITYNAITEKGQAFNPRLYTMRVHRKKHTNTLYTINALNSAIASQHEGKTGKDLPLDWEQYRDTLLLTRGKELNAHPITVLKIFKIEEVPQGE